MIFMKFFSFSLLFFISHSLTAQTIHLKTEHYPPYNYDLKAAGEGVGVGGAATEVVLELMRRSGYSYTLDLVSWKRAYGAAKDEQHTGVYCIVRTPEREKSFKWVGPIAENNYVLLSNGTKDITINSQEDLKNYTVGAYRGSAGEGFIKALGLPLESVRSDHLNALKLQRNRIDLWVAGHLYAPYFVKQLAKKHESLSNMKLQPVYTMQETKMYLAFSLSTPDAVIDKLQGILDKMQIEGFLDSVYIRYK
ncbi:MAG: substrate-binding periplasmic protein [Cellvibrionaceae bacterium]